MTWDVRAPQYQPHASQFAYGLKGSCTLLALAACDIVSKGIGAYVLDPHAPSPNPASTENVQAVMYRIYKEARAHGLCAANGAADQYDMINMAGLIGLPIRDILYYADPMPSDAWVNFLRRHVAHSDRPYPVLVQVANGQALKDADSGSQDQAGLFCHAIAIYGTRTDPTEAMAGGYICCDGDNPAIKDSTVIYSLATLAAARPISMIAFNYAAAKG
jgi:hypothetical protein